MANYINRKYRATDGSYHTWESADAPDPDMDSTTPPHPKLDYSDHVVVQVIPVVPTPVSELQFYTRVTTEHPVVVTGGFETYTIDP